MSVLLEHITVALMPTAPTQMKPSHVLANQDFKATEHPVLVIKDSDNLNSFYMLRLILFRNYENFLNTFRCRRVYSWHP